ncbi:MAG: hypothetical protein KGJ32_12505 [Xanthomonadaceae bacterium]|nr:hypothetical protein [Xanthomonadaceae bacterium]
MNIYRLLLLGLTLALVVAALCLVARALYRAKKTRGEVDEILKIFWMELVRHPSRGRALQSAIRQLRSFAHSFTSITAALALALVALVITLMFLHERSDIRQDANVAAVLQLLEERIPPSSLQTARHHQILSSLEAIRQHAAPPSGFLQSSVTLLLLLLIGLVLSWVCRALPINSVLAKRAVVAVALCAPLSLSLLPSVKGTLFDKLVGSLFRIDMQIPKGSSSETQITLTVRPGAYTALECKPDWVITSFRSGRSDSLESGTIGTEAKRVMASLYQRQHGRRPAALLFIGSVDIQPLSAQTERTFGSNAGLAQSRALHVKHIIDSLLPQPLPTSLALTAGPASTIELANESSSGKISLMARDRSVRICVLWAQ